MIAGRSLQALAAEVSRQAGTKKDFTADTRALTMLAESPEAAGGRPRFRLAVEGNGHYGVGEIAHEQIAGRLGIPERYYDRLSKEHPEILLANVNGLFRRAPERRMVRTLDGRARAFLSDRYRPLDHYDLLQAVLPAIAEIGAEIRSCEVTERRLYVQAVTPKIQAVVARIRPGTHERITDGEDVVQAGLVVSNSEVGMGSVRVEPMIYRLVCSNGAIVADAGMKKYHVGRGHGGEGALRSGPRGSHRPGLGPPALPTPANLFSPLLSHRRLPSGFPPDVEKATARRLLRRTKRKEFRYTQQQSAWGS